MRIPFWFGLIHIGRPTGVGSYRYDVAATLFLGWRGEVPKGEYQWHRIWRVSWNWLPDRIYQQIGAVEPYISAADADAKRLRQIISSRGLTIESSLSNLLPRKYFNAFDSSRWTGRERRLVGIGSWHREFWIHRSTRRSKMYVYLTGSKERTGEHNMYVAPAAVTRDEDCPSDWFHFDDQKTRVPVQFAIKFVNGRASVDNQMGEWLIANKFAQRTNSIIRVPGKALLGSLANTIAGR